MKIQLSKNRLNISRAFLMIFVDDKNENEDNYLKFEPV